MMQMLMKQEQINELVDKFYDRLIKDSYYSTMFAERNVDINVLKERQRSFFARLANSESLTDGHGEVRQVQERHHFGINPERAATWLHYMKETMEDMHLSHDILSKMLEKIQFLIDKMTEKAAE